MLGYIAQEFVINFTFLGMLLVLECHYLHWHQN